jgi:hypothetical protein
MYRPLLERLIEFATGQIPAPQLKEARDAFFKQTGEVYEEDASFETRLACFIEWFVLDRRVDELTNAEQFMQRLVGEEITFGAQLAATHRSLFSVQKFGESNVLLLDLLGNGRFSIAGEVPPGIRKGDIFEGRVIPWGDKVLLSRTLLFHPSEAKDAIMRQVSTAKLKSEAPDALMARLARMRLRVERYRKIPLEKIYDPNALFGR